MKGAQQSATVVSNAEGVIAATQEEEAQTRFYFLSFLHRLSCGPRAQCALMVKRHSGCWLSRLRDVLRFNIGSGLSVDDLSCTDRWFFFLLVRVSERSSLARLAWRTT